VGWLGGAYNIADEVVHRRDSEVELEHCLACARRLGACWPRGAASRWLLVNSY
jgi:hypothetical protein